LGSILKSETSARRTETPQLLPSWMSY